MPDTTSSPSSPTSPRPVLRRLVARVRRAVAPSTAADRNRPRPPAGGYPGDFTGVPPFDYAPEPDGQPDAGEIVWAWVPFEEDHTRGKDRPVLLVGSDPTASLARGWLLALQLTSKDHDRDAEQERRAGRLWMDIGSGAWDVRGRPSEVRLNRVIRVDPEAVRREGAALDRQVFEAVAAAARAALA
ncbi:type II toxin-antitoxin system PemK/MazF family toxin [Barrientosiimonas humi]|uniref:type II toxin-antitoxin system PemK/MazF family toxin n=1 Tax=Barrientosiimonas humi TaxID=999931 RepID=UPI00370D3C31